MTADNTWTPVFTLDEFDKRMENAFRRVSGSIGFDISVDRGDTRVLKERAAQAFESGMDSAGPLFMRFGKSALDIAAYSPKGTVNLHDCAGEVLLEFFEEGNAAYQAAKASLYADALVHLEEFGFDAEHCKSILANADASFAPPSKEAFTRQGASFCKEGATPSMQAALGGGAVFAAIILLMRSPVVASLLGVLAAGAMYYFARSNHRAKAERLARNLPKRLYQLLLSGLNTNVKRYADTVNAAIAGRVR